MTELEEMKRLADEIAAEGEAFVLRMKEHDRRMEREHREMMRMIYQADENWKRVNKNLNTLRHGQSEYLC